MMLSSFQLFGEKTMKKRPPPVLYVLVLICALYAIVLRSCSLFQGSPTFIEPTKDSLAGTYSVENISWFASNRQELKSMSLILASNGTYELRTPHDRVSSLLIPARSGEWSLSPMRGMDLGSRETWGISFVPVDGAASKACLLENKPPYRIMFIDYSKRTQFGDLLVWKKDDHGGEDGSPSSRSSP